MIYICGGGFSATVTVVVCNITQHTGFCIMRVFSTLPNHRTDYELNIITAQDYANCDNTLHSQTRNFQNLKQMLVCIIVTKDI